MRGLQLGLLLWNTGYLKRTAASQKLTIMKNTEIEKKCIERMFNDRTRSIFTHLSTIISRERLFFFNHLFSIQGAKSGHLQGWCLLIR